MKHSGLIKVLVAVFIIAAIGIAGYIGFKKFDEAHTVTTVYVDGNIHYTEEEIKDMVMTGRFGHNSFFLERRYKNKPIDNIPFVETMDVTVLEPDTIKISVYEKALAGYIEYLGKYVYFDKDGIVNEVSNVKTQGLPEVIGIDFDYVILYEELPTEDKNLFKSVLNMTQLLTKYGVEAQKMYFKDNGEIVIYHDDVVINLGTDKDIDIKIMNLPALLDNLVGMKGTLRMENYNENTKKVSFDPAD